MDESIRDLLVRGIAAAKANEKHEARFYLEWALRLDPPLDQRVEAWFWLSEVCEDPKEKRSCLEEVLAYQPGHQPARRSLAILDGRLDPGAIVDPDRLPAENPVSGDLLQFKRFICPQCGGRMVFQPDGLSLTCEYCEDGRKIIRQDGRTTSHDFTIDMATARGHTSPVDTRSFECKACGAIFLLSPKILSLTCPYCASVYVIETAENRALIPPDLLIPFSFDQAQIRRLLSSWVKEHQLVGSLAETCGTYLPVWHFTLSGRLPVDEYDQNEFERLNPFTRDNFILKDVLIPAGKSLPAIKADFIQHFDVKQAVPYDPAYLADWPAETYQISLSDASLQARLHVIDQLTAGKARPINNANGQVGINSMDLLVQAYHLILVPAWITHLGYHGEPLTLVVNGQNGNIYTNQPLRRGWLSRLVEAI